jgi:hypothetical protein
LGKEEMNQEAMKPGKASYESMKNFANEGRKTGKDFQESKERIRASFVYISGYYFPGFSGSREIWKPGDQEKP